MNFQTSDELQTKFDEAKSQAEKEYDWYAKRRWGYVILSWLTRGTAALLLASGVILPLTGSTAAIEILHLKFTGPAQAGLACLALAGLLVGANQVFMISSTWIRYVGAMLKIRTLIKAAEFDWTAQKAGLTEPVPTAEAQKALAAFNALGGLYHNRLSENMASLFSSLNHKKWVNTVAKQKFNDIIKRHEIFKAKPHQAVKTFH